MRGEMKPRPQTSQRQQDRPATQDFNSRPTTQGKERPARGVKPTFTNSSYKAPTTNRDYTNPTQEIAALDSIVLTESKRRALGKERRMNGGANAERGAKEDWPTLEQEDKMRKPQA